MKNLMVKKSICLVMVLALILAIMSSLTGCSTQSTDGDASINKVIDIGGIDIGEPQLDPEPTPDNNGNGNGNNAGSNNNKPIKPTDPPKPVDPPKPGGSVDIGKPDTGPSEPGIDDGIDDETDGDIIHKDWYQGVDISKRSDFDPNDVSIAINNTVKSLKAGENAYLPYGNYKYKSTLEIVNKDNDLDGCQIVLDGTYAQSINSKFDAMHVEGNNLTLIVSHITNGRNNPDYSTTRSSGIVINKSYNSNYWFKEVIGFEYGIKLEPTEADIENNNIQFRYLGNCKYPIFMKAQEGKNFSANKNTFTGGRVRGNTGLTMDKGDAQVKRHTMNLFNKIAWESIESYGINNIYAERCDFYTSRFESVMGANIIDGPESIGNVFFNTVALPIEKKYRDTDEIITNIDIKSKNASVFMPLHGTTPLDTDKQAYWQELIYLYQTNDKAQPSYYFYENKFVEATTGDFNVPLNAKHVKVDAKSAAVNLKLHKMAGHTNNTTYIYINDATKGVKLLESNGTTIKTSSELTKGTYKLTYNGSYSVEKISDSGILN